MKVLRERGIYKLPDGEELVASSAPRGGGYALYNQQVWKRYGVPDYQIDLQGRLTRSGESTRLRIDDLEDTGRTAE